MNEFVWTFAVASMALIAGYMMCALLSLDARQKNERAVRRVRHLADTGSIAAPDLTDHDKGWNAALAALRDALDGDSDD